MQAIVIAKTSPTRAVGYIRVSKSKQEISPEAQRAAIDNWCEANGCVLVAVHSDIGVSGGTPLDKCPALLAALDSLRDEEASVLLLAKRDRLGRDVLKAALVERLTQRASAEVVSADGAGNGNSPEAQLMRTMIDAFAQYERALIRARTKAALAQKKSKGQRVGRIPYGWQLAIDGNQIEPNPEEQEVIAQIWGLRTTGASQQAIADELNNSGIVARGVGDQPTSWKQATVSRLLRREKQRPRTSQESSLKSKGTTHAT